MSAKRAHIAQWRDACKLWRSTLLILTRLDGRRYIDHRADPERMSAEERDAAGWRRLPDGSWYMPLPACHDAALSLAAACRALLPHVERSGLSADRVREVAAMLRSAPGWPTIATFDAVAALQLHVVDELETKRPRKAAKRERKESLDTQAMSAVERFEDVDSDSYKPGWSVSDVARELGVSHAALSGRQRDGSPRCPNFTRHRRKNGRAPVTRRRGRV